MSLLWFSPNVPVRTEVGHRYNCNNVQGAITELLKWSKRGRKSQIAADLCLDALDHKVRPEVLRDAFREAAAEQGVLLPTLWLPRAVPHSAGHLVTHCGTLLATKRWGRGFVGGFLMVSTEHYAWLRLLRSRDFRTQLPRVLGLGVELTLPDPWVARLENLDKAEIAHELASKRMPPSPSIGSSTGPHNDHPGRGSAPPQQR
ncbi:DUF982 domain-containing protein [Mesorhizobium australicum]|uniref:DUF982 domain-containing protein n=1 Tax=Mesorhizobium australicum TaxID=536018 RepID=UPI003336C7B1